MDYQHHNHQPIMNDGKGAAEYYHHDGISSPPSRQTTNNRLQQHESRRDQMERRVSVGSNASNRIVEHRHHTIAANSITSRDTAGSNGIQPEVVSSSPSESADQDQYETIKEEPNSDSYDSSENDRFRNNGGKIPLNADIQYWFDQKKKIDQLLLPFPEKGTSTPNVTVKNCEKNKIGPKSPPGRLNSNIMRISKLNTNQNPLPQQKQQQQQHQIQMSGERNHNERNLTKKIFEDVGKISAKDLKEAFATYQNKHFSDGVCKFVVRLFDLDRNGGLDIKEFEQLYSYIKLWVSAYHVYDRHHAGYLSEKDFHNALKHMDIHFSPEFISFLVTRCDPINRRVSLSQFIVTCVQIQKYTDEFKNRDDNYSGTINLRYEDFLEMVLRCL